jgi:hypothetical protein
MNNTIAIDKLSLIQRLIATEDQSLLGAVDSLLVDKGSKIPDWLYSELLQQQQSRGESLSNWNELKENLLQ